MTVLNWEDDSATKDNGRNPEGVRAIIEGALLRPDKSAAAIDTMLTKANVAHPKHFSTIVPVARHTVEFLIAFQQPIKVGGKLYRLVQVQSEPVLIKNPENVEKGKAA